jgi:hypothetical protein
VEKALVETSWEKADKRLREHIRHLLTQVGVDREHSPDVIKQVEDQMMQLAWDYAAARESNKDAIYAQREAQVLQTLRRPQAN